ncbi:TPA: hypothetical protein HA265_03540, partial [Candidatus Woesearchaeota archaeon]|nr:hypothetical protein [Candidatus Woesearchaeota archaeon]
REKGNVDFSETDTALRFAELRDWMYQNVYKKIDDDFQELALKKTYDFLAEMQLRAHPALLLSLMTDEELNVMARFFMRQRAPELEQIKYFGVFEILPYLEGRILDFMDPDLGWKDEAVR